jgi:transcriptional regulator with XRE-family HTH domain
MAGCQQRICVMRTIKTYPADLMSPSIDSIRVRFSEVVRELLEEQGITQADLADAIHIHPSVLSNYLTGSRPLDDLSCVVNTARRLGVTVAYLLGETTDIAQAQRDAILEAVVGLSGEQLRLVADLAREMERKPGPTQ